MKAYIIQADDGHVFTFSVLDEYTVSVDASSIILSVDNEDAPVERARGTIKDLKDGKLPSTIVRDLGEAVKQATRDSGVGDAISRGNRISGGMAR